MSMTLHCLHKKIASVWTDDDNNNCKLVELMKLHLVLWKTDHSLQTLHTDDTGCVTQRPKKISKEFENMV